MRLKLIKKNVLMHKDVFSNAAEWLNQLTVCIVHERISEKVF